MCTIPRYKKTETDVEPSAIPTVSIIITVAIAFNRFYSL